MICLCSKLFEELIVQPFGLLSQAGCTIRTECEVQYVVRNDDDVCREGGGFTARSKRRWLVFLNEFDYVASDIVILSGLFI